MAGPVYVVIALLLVLAVVAAAALARRRRPARAPVRVLAEATVETNRASVAEGAA